MAKTSPKAVIEVFQRGPSNEAAFEAVKEVLTRTKQWAELLKQYHLAIKHADLKRSERLLFEAGVIAETRLQNLDTAAKLYEQSFLKQKQNSKALRALRALEESRKNHKGILHALRLQLKTKIDKKQKTKVLIDIAEIYQNQLKDAYKAIESYRLALDEDPSRKDILVKVENLCRQKKRWNELVRVYKKLAINFKGSREAGFYHFCAALVFDEQLKDPRNAAVAFSFALKNKITDLKKLERIRSFAITHKKDELQIQVLAIGSRKNRSQSDRHRMTLDLADLYSKRAKDPQSLKKAEQEVQKVLGENPRSEPALTLLEKIYKKRDPGPDAKISLLQQQMANLELGDKKRQAVFAELGALREQNKDYEGSTAAYRGVLAVDPNDIPARLGLARIARVKEDWQEFNLLLNVLNKELKADDPQNERHFLELQKQRAFLYREPRPDPELEQEALKLYLQGVPGDLPTLERLMVLADGAGEQEQWSQFLEQQAKLCPNKEQQLDLYQRLAVFREEALSDELGAAEAWEFLDQNSDAREDALEALERLYQSTDHPNHLASVLRRQAEYFMDGNLKALALRKLGALLRDKLDSPRQAIHVLRDAWAIDPEAQNIMETLEELLTTEEDEGDDLDRAWVLREISRHSSDTERKQAIQKELVTAYMTRERDKEALALLDDVLSQNPSDEEAFEQLVTVLERQDKLDEIWFYFKKSLLSDSEKVLDIARRLNALYEEKLDKDDKAPLIELWRHTVEILPGNEEATRAYVSVARSLKGQDYRRALESLIDITDPEEERLLQIELGRLHRESGQLEKARTAFLRAHEINPEDQDALDALRSVLALLSKHQELLTLLQDSAESLKIQFQSSPSKELADRIRRLALDAAELADEKLNDPSKSLVLLESCHNEFHHIEILERLISLYRKTKRTRALSDALGQFVEYCDNNEQRSLVLLEKAQLDRELLERPRDALDSYNKAIEEDPKNGELWLARAAVHENLGEWREALSDLERGGEYSGAVKSGLAAIERRRGILYRDSLKDDENAENCFKNARSADPDGLENHKLLIDFYERRALYPQLQEALSAAANHTPDQDARATLLARRGEVLARFLGKIKAAIKDMDKALELRPGDLRLMDLKIRLLRHAERPDDLVKVLEERRNAFFSLGDDEQRIRRGYLLREEALLRGWELGDFEKGRELLSEAVSLVPERLEWVEDALLLERRSRNWKRRLNLLKRAADRVRSFDPKRRAGYLIEAGVLCFQQLEDIERARRYFKAALASDSEAFEALHWLQIMAGEEKDTSALLGTLTQEYELRKGREKDRIALRIGEIQESEGDLEKAKLWFERASESGSRRALRELNQVLDALGEPEALFESTLRLAQAEESKQRRRSVLLRLAERLVELEDKTRASQAYRSVLESFPGDIRALRGLANLLDPSEDTDELMALIEKELDAGVGPARFVELQLRLGHLRWKEKNDGDAGKSHFLKIIERDVRDEAALSALKNLYIESHDWASLAKLYEQIAREANLAPEKEEAFRQAALIYHHHEPKDLAKAKELYFKVLEFGDPECVAIDALPPLLKDDGSIEEKRLVMSLTAQIVPGSTRAKRALLELGAECHEAKDLEKARLYWTKALGWTAGDVLADEGRLSPVEEEALERLLTLEREQENWKSVSDYLALKILGSPKEETRLGSMVERGILLKNQLKDEMGALEIFEAVFQSDPQNDDAINSLRELYQGLGRGGGLSRLLNRAAEHADNEERRCELLLEQVEVDESRGEHHGAMECLRQLARYRPNDIELRRRLGTLQEDCGEDVRFLITLDELVELLEGEERLDIYLQKSEVLERLERRAEACELLEKVLEEWTKRENPKARELVERLRSLAEEAGDDRLVLLTRETELRWLLLKARQEEDHVYQSEVEELTSRVSRLHVAADNLNMAESWLERSLEVYPDSKALFLSLRTVVEVSGDELRFVEVVERRCALCDASEEAELRGELAELLEQDCDDAARAFTQWEKILELCPGSFAALRSLQRLAWTLNRRDRALEMCERELEYLERLGPVPWNKVPGGKEGKLDNGPLLQKAFEERGQKAQQYDLKSLRGDTSGYPEEELEALVACLCYGHKVGGRDEDDSSRPVLPERFGDYVSRIYRKAAIVAWDLDELDRAAKYLERAYFLVPKDEMARLHLAEVHEFRKDWTALAAILRARWIDVRQVSERVSLGLRLADLEEKRGEHQAALSVLQSIWQESDGDPTVLSRMQSLQNTLGDYEGLLKTLRWQAERCQDKDQECSFLLERGRILEDELNRPDDALIEYEAVLQLKAGDMEALTRLTKIFESKNDYERLVDQLLRSARLSDSGEQSQQLFERAARLSWTELKDAERARSYIESALRFGPGNADILDLWVEVERGSPGSKTLADALKSQARLLSKDEKKERLFEIAQLELGRDPDECIRLVDELLESLEAGTEECSAALRLKVEARRLGRSKGALIEALKSRQEDPQLSEADRLRDLEEWATLALGLGVGYRRSAAEALEAKLELCPGDLETLSTLIELFKDEPVTRLRWLERALSCPLDADKEVELLELVTDLSTRVLHDAARAVPAYQRLLEIQPDNQRALSGLLQILEREGRHGDALETIDRELALFEDQDPLQDWLVELRLRRARIFEEVVFDLDAAYAAYKSVFSLFDDAAESELYSTVFTAYESFLRRRGRFESLVGLLEARATRAEEDGLEDEARRLWQEQAMIYEGKLEDPEGTCHCFERALELDPEDQNALIGIQRSLRVLGRWKRLEEIQEIAIPLEEDLERRAWLSYQRGLILEEELNRLDDAMESYELSLYVDPLHLGAIRRLGRIYKDQGDFEELARIWDLEVKAVDDKSQKGVVLSRLADLYQDQLNQLEQAEDSYREAIQLYPTLLDAYDGLARLLKADERYASLAELLADQLKVVKDSRRLRAIRRERANLLEKQLEAPHSAIDVWAQLFEEDPSQPFALAGLLRCKRQLEDWSGVAELVETALAESEGFLGEDSYNWLIEAARALQLIDDEGSRERAIDLAQRAFAISEHRSEAIELLMGLCHEDEQEALIDIYRVHAEALPEKTDAITYLEQSGRLALKWDATTAAKVAFEGLLKIDDSHLEALEELEKIAREDEDWAMVTRCLEKRRALNRMGRFGECYLRLGEVYERLDQIAFAVSAYEMGLDDVKKSKKQPFIKRLRPCLESLERWDELSNVLKIGAELAPRGSEAWVDCLQARGRLLCETLNRHDLAADVYETLMTGELEPALHEMAFQKLTSLLEELGQFSRLKDALLVEATRQGDEGSELWLKLGILVEETLSSPGESLRFYRKAHELDPANLDTLAHLKTLLYQFEYWSELVKVLDKSSRVITDSETLYELNMELGQVSEEKLGRLERAENYYSSACHLELRHRDSFVALARVQQEQSRFADLVSTLADLRSLSKNEKEQLAIDKRMALIYQDSLFREDQALSLYQDILQRYPDDPETLAAMARIYSDLGAHEKLTQVLARQAVSAKDVPTAIRLYLELAKIWSESLRSPEKALTTAIDPALGLDPTNIELLRYKLETCRTLEYWEGVVQSLQRLLTETNKDDPDYCGYLEEMAGVLNLRLRRGVEARTFIDQLLQHPLVRPEQLSFVIEFFRANQLRTDLIRALKIQESKTSDPTRKAALLAEIAWTEFEPGQDDEKRRALFREALSHDETCISALWGLAKGAPNPDTVEERLEALDVLGDIEQDRQRKIEALLLASDICREEIENFEDARAHLEGVLMLDASCFMALAGLAELHYALEEWELALPYFKGVMRSRQFGEDGERCADLFHAYGVVCQNLGYFDDASTAFRRALEYQPDHLASLEDLGQSMLEEGNWESAVGIFEKLVQRTRIPKARAAHELSLALALKEVGQIDRSLELYRRALQQNADHAGARLQYASLLLQQGNVDGARVCYEQVLSAPGVESMYRGEALVQLADLYTQNYRDANQGTTLLLAALEQVGPHQSGAAKRLAEIYGHNNRWPEAAQQLKRAIELEANPLEASYLWASLGRLSRDRLGNADYARLCFENAIQTNPDDAKTLDSLIRLLGQVGDFASMDRYLVDAINRSVDEYTAATFRLQRAELLWKQFKNRREAIVEYEQVMKSAPEEKEARRALARLYVEVGDEAKALETHRQWLVEEPLRVACYQALGAVFQGTGKNQAYIQTLHSLAILRGASPEELRVLNSYLKHAPNFAAGIQDQLYFRLVMPKEIPASLGRILKVLGPWARLLYPSDLKPYGLNRKNLMDYESPDQPYGEQVRRVVQFFNLKDKIDIYWMPNWRRPEIVMERSQDKAIMMMGPAAFEGLNDAEILFSLGRQLAPVYGGYDFVPKHGSAGLYRFVKMVAEALTTQLVKESNDSAGQIKVAAGMLNKQLKPETKRRVGPLAEELWEQRTRFDFGRVAHILDWTSSRFGMLLAGGAYPAAEAQFKTNVLLGGSLGASTEDVQRQLQDNQMMKELLRYSVSEEYLELIGAL